MRALTRRRPSGGRREVAVPATTAVALARRAARRRRARRRAATPTSRPAWADAEGLRDPARAARPHREPAAAGRARAGAARSATAGLASPHRWQASSRRRLRLPRLGAHRPPGRTRSARVTDRPSSRHATTSLDGTATLVARDRAVGRPSTSGSHVVVHLPGGSHRSARRGPTCGCPSRPSGPRTTRSRCWTGPGCPRLRYLWGGTSAWAWTAPAWCTSRCATHGVLVPRDAFDQAASPQVEPVPLDAVRPGDLYFFARPGDQIYHVGFVTRPVDARRRPLDAARARGRRRRDRGRAAGTAPGWRRWCRGRAGAGPVSPRRAALAARRRRRSRGRARAVRSRRRAARCAPRRRPPRVAHGRRSPTSSRAGLRMVSSSSVRWWLTASRAPRRGRRSPRTRRSSASSTASSAS